MLSESGLVGVLRRAALPIAAAGVVLAGLVVWLVAGSSHSDLEVYRFGVDALWAGRDLYGDLPLSAAGIPLPFIYPPFAAVVLTPFAAVPLGWSVLLLFAVNLVSLGITLYAVARNHWPSAGRRGALAVASLAAAPALMLEPVRETFGFGQINLPLMCLVAADCLLFRGRYRGIGVGIAAAIKLTPMAFVLFFLVRREPRAMVTSFATFGVATGLGFLIAPESSSRYWFGGLAGASGMSGTPFHTNQTLRAVLTRLGFEAGTVKPVWFVLTAVLLGLAVLAMRKLDAVPALVLNATFALLISPTSWSHHWVWIAPALLFVLMVAVSRRSWLWFAAAVVLGVVFVIAPFRYYPAFDRPGLDWTPGQQWLGNCYVFIGLAVILGAAAAAVVRSRQKVPSTPT